MTTTPATYTYADGETVDTATGEAIDYQIGAVAPYHPPTEEEFIIHDYPLQGSALVPARLIKEIVLAGGTEEERERRAFSLTIYKNGPSVAADPYLNNPVRVIGAFEFILPPFETLDKVSNKPFIKRDAAVQKIRIQDASGKKVMLRFGAESAAEFVAIWTGAYRDFDFPEGKYVNVIIRSEIRNGKKTYSFELLPRD